MTVADDAIADDESKTSTGADGFGGEKRLEHARLDVSRNPGAVIHNFHNKLIVFKRGADTDFAGAINRSDRVINQVGPDLIEFAAISHDVGYGAIKGPNDGHVFQFVTQHGQG